MEMNGEKKVTCVIPARNEAGRLRETIQEAISTKIVSEIIIIEGGSSDDTWLKSLDLQREFEIVKAIQQTGIGKFNAVREGVSVSSGELIIVWDADGTVRSKDSVNLINTAISENRTVIGNRILGVRHPGSMRSANLLGNIAFALLWFPFLKGKFMDLLCGSKVFTREDFDNIPQKVLQRDPFGDFALIASSIVRGSYPISVPVEYFPREYGETNIKRWSSGLKLLRTSLVCFRWILREKFEGGQ